MALNRNEKATLKRLMKNVEILDAKIEKLEAKKEEYIAKINPDIQFLQSEKDLYLPTIMELQARDTPEEEVSTTEDVVSEERVVEDTQVEDDSIAPEELPADVDQFLSEDEEPTTSDENYQSPWG